MDFEKYDTPGKRLRYFREEEVGESREKFTVALDVTPRTLERYENDESSPDASFFTKLNSKYHETINLDWLLTGRGNLYLQGKFRLDNAKEETDDYHDAVLEKMHQQLDRIYMEKEFSKLAALQSLLNLIDPSGEKEET
jgi:transcriptional regulator with XRE-family HTH domain